MQEIFQDLSNVEEYSLVLKAKFIHKIVKYRNSFLIKWLCLQCK